MAIGSPVNGNTTICIFSQTRQQQLTLLLLTESTKAWNHLPGALITTTNSFLLNTTLISSHLPEKISHSLQLEKWKPKIDHMYSQSTSVYPLPHCAPREESNAQTGPVFKWHRHSFLLYSMIRHGQFCHVFSTLFPSRTFKVFLERTSC